MCVCVYWWINLREFAIFHFVTLHLQENRIFLKWCFWCSIKHVSYVLRGEKPSELSMKSGFVFFFFLLKQQVNACLLFLQGLLAFRHSRFFFLQFQSEGNDQCCATGVLQILLYCSSLSSHCYKNTLSDLFQVTQMFFSGVTHLLPFSLC